MYFFLNYIIDCDFANLLSPEDIKYSWSKLAIS